MAEKTNFLNLTLPGNSEYNDNWDEPMNQNFVKIDEEVESISNEILSARFTKSSLAEFLGVSHYSDGTLIPSEEALAARNSKVYGSNDSSGNDYQLKQRLDLGDMETYTARERSSSMISAMAFRFQDFNYMDSVISAASTAEGMPNYLSSAASEFKIDSTPIPVVINIDGYKTIIEDDESVQVSGGDGTKYLVAKRPATPYIVTEKPTEEVGITTANALNSDKVQVFVDQAVDFPALLVRPGYILELLNTGNAGKYIIDEVGFDGDITQLLIIGNFVNALGGINYRITDPMRPEFSVESSYVKEKGKVYLGEGEYASGSLISSKAYSFKHKFESPYQAVDVSSLADFELIINHDLGFIPKEIEAFVSQADNDSEPVEKISTSGTGNDLSVLINNTLSHTPGIFDPGTTDATYTQATLVGDVTGSIDGAVYDLRSVRIKVTKTQIFIKNVKPNHFYRDYDDVDRQIGFIKVVCK